MDYSPRFDSTTTLTRELPEDWRPDITRQLVWVAVPTAMEIEYNPPGLTTDIQPAAATYTTPASLIAALNIQLAIVGAPWSAINISINGLGLCVMSCVDDFDVTFSSATLMTALGFTGNLTGADTYTSTNVVKLPMVLPDIDASVYDTGGDSLDTGSASCPGWYVTTATANRGARTLTCSADGVGVADWEQGRRALIYSETGASAEFVTVEAASFAGSVCTLSLRERLGFPHALGVYVIPWWVTYDLDATDETVFTRGNKGTVVWTPVTVWEYPDLVDTWSIREMVRDLGATEAKFKAVFPRIYGSIRDGQDFAEYVSDAHEGLRQWLSGHGQDIDALTDRRPVERLLLREIAWTVAGQAGEDFAGEFERLEKMRAEARQDYAAVIRAQDADQNHVITEEENSAADQPLPMRIW